MKKKLSLSILSLLIGIYTLQAQSADFGIKAGANYSNINSDNKDIDYKSIPGLHVGVFASIQAVTDKFELQPEILYSLQGSDASTSGVNRETRLHYIYVPVIAKIFPLPVSNFNIQVGPQIGLVLDANSTTAGVKEDVKDQFKSRSFDVVVGVGYDVLNKVDIALRYAYGFTDINDNAVISETVQNAILQLSVGIVLN